MGLAVIDGESNPQTMATTLNGSSEHQSHTLIKELPAAFLSDISAIKTAVELLDNDPATATLQGTANTELAAIKTAVQALSGIITDSALDVNATIDTTGLSTEAKQDSAITELTAIKTAVQILDNDPATATLQSAINTTLGSMDTKLGIMQTALQLLDNDPATATLQGTANTALAAIQAAVEILDNDPATATLQGTANTALAAIRTAVEALDNAVDGAALAVNLKQAGITLNAANSSTATLTSSATFTGTGVDCSDYASVAVNVEASHDSGSSGMQFQWSSDNSNWDVVDSFTYASASGGYSYESSIKARYFRVVYTNGGTGQTHFRLQTLLRLTSASPASSGGGGGDASASNQTTMITELTAIKNAVQLLDNAISGSELQVDVLSTVLPTDAATETKQDSAITELTAIKTAIQLLDNSVDGSALAVNLKQAGITIDANNSTTSTLTSSATYTGTGTDCSNYASVAVSVEASHDSGASGMTFEWSSDNSNWDVSEAFTYSAASGGYSYESSVKARYFRVRYVNGGTGQSHFRVQTLLRLTSASPTSSGGGGDASASNQTTMISELTAIKDAVQILDNDPATATLQGTANTALAAIQAAVETLDNAISGTEMQVDVLSTVLAADAATATLQGTGNTALAAIQAAVELIDNTVSGTELQVDVVTSALPSDASTETKQDSMITELTAIKTAVQILDNDPATATLQGTANTALSAIQTAVELLDNAVNGSNLNVNLNGITRPTSPETGQMTVSTSPVALNGGSSLVVDTQVIVVADEENSVPIYVGKSGVSTSTGVKLNPGMSLPIEVANINTIYAICASGSPLLTWICPT